MLSTFTRYAKSPLLWQFALACYWLALFIVTHIPIERLALSRGAADKFAHVAAFAGLAVIFAVVWQLSFGRLTLQNAIWIWLTIALYGAIEELTQPIVNRTASGKDWIADGCGASLGLAIYYFALRPWFGPATKTSSSDSSPTRSSSWFRFSLKAVFVLMALVAAACYWCVLPTIKAQRFVVALHNKDYAAAEGLFISYRDAFPGEFKQTDRFSATAKLMPITWNEFLKGERQVLVRISYMNERRKTINCGAGIFAYRNGLAMHPLVLPLPSPISN